MIRKPVVAGQFYEADRDKLLRQIEGSFSGPFGPGKSTKAVGKYCAFIVPHAGYYYSAQCAAHAYKIIASLPVKTFIILGPNHSGMNASKSAISKRDWETPLGIARCNLQLANMIQASTEIVESDLNHAYEHSIEVQLPFLQYVKQDFTFVPISVSPMVDYIGLGRKLADLLFGEDVCLIVSSDFTHYGPNFDYVPFRENVKESLKKLDMGAVDRILNLDPEGLDAYQRKTHATICGIHPIMLLLAAIRSRARPGKLLKYYSSGEISGDFTSSVSYCSIGFQDGDN